MKTLFFNRNLLFSAYIVQVSTEQSEKSKAYWDKWKKKEDAKIIARILSHNDSEIDMFDKSDKFDTKITKSLYVLSHLEDGRVFLDSVIPLILANQVTFKSLTHSSRSGCARANGQSSGTTVEIGYDLNLAAFILSLAHEATHSIDLEAKKEFRNIKRNEEGYLAWLALEHKAYRTQIKILESMRKNFPSFNHVEGGQLEPLCKPQWFCMNIGIYKER